jgi:hypothetical protein
MNAPNFSSILDKPFDSEANRPKPLPVGSYLCIVDGIPKFDKSTQQQTEYVEFTLKPVSAQGDVDQQALTEAGGLSDKTLKTTFYLTEKAVFRLDDFLENLGLDKGTVSRKEGVSMAPGRQILAVVRHASSKDGKAIYANVDSTARV